MGFEAGEWAFDFVSPWAERHIQALDECFLFGLFASLFFAPIAATKARSRRRCEAGRSHPPSRPPPASTCTPRTGRLQTAR